MTSVALVSRADMLTLWAAHDLVAFSGARLRELGVPECAARILVEVGLPAVAEPFFFSEGFLRLQPAGCRVQGWRFGGDGGDDLCIEAGTGHVVADGTAVGAATRFVNSSLEQFAGSLYAAVGSYRRFAGLDDDACEVLLDGMEAQLHDLDAAALAGQENWWAVLIEQMHDGLL
jgi:hypothetical protein